MISTTTKAAPPHVSRLRKPDLLSPAGNWACVRAAIENGADAIYFGVGRFNARVRAQNFTIEELPQLMADLHQRGVRGYVAFNTLIFADEMAEAEATLRQIIVSGVDAAIVQDVGIARLIRRLSPDFPIHASTQMTITSTAGLKFAQALGASLVVLARECSIAEMQKMREESGGQYPVPVETFVHGALCVAYSGQCLTSESLGGRSANRGECAQACRMPYELLADGQLVPLGDRKYLLSPQDLAGLDALPELIRAGVHCLKIEGRLKTPEYVANITRVYRDAIDRIYARLETDLCTQPSLLELHQKHDYAMEMAFSRGLYTGWLRGIDNQQLVHGRFGTKRGALLGRIVRVSAPQVWLQPETSIKAGDGVVFDAGQPEAGEEGGRILKVEAAQPLPQDPSLSLVKLTFHQPSINWQRVAAGQLLWKTSDPELEKELRYTFTQAQPLRKTPICACVSGRDGTPLEVSFSDPENHTVTAATTVLLQPALNQPLETAFLREQLGRLGGTTYELVHLENRLEGRLILPVSSLNQVRRELVTLLDAKRRAPRRWTLLPAGPLPLHRPQFSGPTAALPTEAEIIPLVRSQEQLLAVLSWGALVVYCEWEDPKKYRQAVQTVRSWEEKDGLRREIWVAPPRIFKTGEEWILRIVRSAQADGYLVRNHEHLQAFADARRRGDFSLNVANPLTAEYFLQQYGLERVTASYDLNIEQLDALLRQAPPSWFEITLQQHMPMFHMEHCVFCAFLSSGKDYRDCGRPCEKVEVRLRDRTGAEHFLLADAGCRNTLYNARAQTGAEYARHLQRLGIRHFRIEFLRETADEVQRTLRLYRQLLDGRIEGSTLWKELRIGNQLGVTRGTLRNDR